jgi:hypothetical protein
MRTKRWLPRNPAFPAGGPVTITAGTPTRLASQYLYLSGTILQ